MNSGTLQEVPIRCALGKGGYVLGFLLFLSCFYSHSCLHWLHWMLSDDPLKCFSADEVAGEDISTQNFRFYRCIVQAIRSNLVLGAGKGESCPPLSVKHCQGSWARGKGEGDALLILPSPANG